jgi:hypothetical protein
LYFKYYQETEKKGGRARWWLRSIYHFYSVNAKSQVTWERLILKRERASGITKEVSR